MAEQQTEERMDESEGAIPQASPAQDAAQAGPVSAEPGEQLQAGAQDEGSDPEGKPAYDYEAERAKKLAFRASLTDEDIARMRKTGRPANYRFGQKIAEGIENVQESGDEEQRKRSVEDIEREQRIEAAARVDDWQAKLDQMSFDERVQATIDCLGRRQSFARVLRATMEYCLEERSSEDVEAYIETLPDYAANRQSARRYVFFLMRTGALDEAGYDAEGNLVDVRSVAAVQEQLAPAATDESDADAAAPDAENPEVAQTAGAGVEDAEKPAVDDAAADEKAPVADDENDRAESTAATDAALEATDVVASLATDDAAPATTSAATFSAAEAAEDDAPAGAADDGASDAPAPIDPEDLIVEWRISTTDAGRAALEATDAHGRLTTLLEEQTSQDRYAAYLDLLTFCEEPRALAEISEFLIGNPGLEIDDRGIVHMQPNAYIGKLDTAGALTWTGSGWQTTPQAREVLQTL